jgi:hypothetical protein
MVRDTNYFADQIAARYPELPRAQVRKLCQQLMRRIYGLATNDRDVRLTSGSRKLSLKIYKPDRSHTDHNARVAPEAKKRFRRQFAKRTPTPPTLPAHE